MWSKVKIILLILRKALLLKYLTIEFHFALFLNLKLFAYLIA